jgi:hypothetical protein
VTIAEDVDAGVRDALLPPVVDKPCTKEYVELARGLFQAVEATFEMTHLRHAIGEAKGLADVHVLFDGGVEDRRVDINLTHFKSHAAEMARKWRWLAMRMIGKNVSV